MIEVKLQFADSEELEVHFRLVRKAANWAAEIAELRQSLRSIQKHCDDTTIWDGLDRVYRQVCELDRQWNGEDD
jgi:hypothetical protein